jgi:hypothetical protein
VGLAADAYARMMTALLPPGRLWRLVGSVLSDLLLACADELARLDARVDDLLDEADPSTATELIPEYESELDLEPSDGVAVAALLVVALMGVETDSANWQGELTATEAGEAGNSLTLHVIIFEQAPDAIEVRDGEVYVDPTGWIATPNAIGVLVGAGGGALAWTVADLEAEINATSLLAQVTTVDFDPTKVLEEQVERIGTFAGGLDAEAEARARIVGRLIARQRYRPVDFQEALALILGLDAADVVVIETSAALAASMGDAREIFRFFIYRDPSEPGAYYLDSAQELVDQIKPSHTAGHVIESIDFLCDDPGSLCDRDLIGA